MISQQIPFQILQQLDTLWTFFLLLTRYIGMMLVIPGIGMGARGLVVRNAAAFSFAFASLGAGPKAVLPDNWIVMALMAVSELALGGIVGLVPAMIVAGAQTAGHISSTSMGLGASQLVDPSSGVQNTAVAQLFGDLTVAVFLLTGGHRVMIYALSGLSGHFAPGTFFASDASLSMLVQNSADIFRVGVVLSAPVIVALLLTQFVMGLMSRAVPTVNIFIVSFPLTIGIGLLLSMLSMPEMVVFMQREMIQIERGLDAVVTDSQNRQ